MAEEFLKQANAAYVDEDWDTALDLYTKAIDAKPNDGGLFSARAQAHIKLEDWLSAAEDAGKAVQLDAANAKAHFRRGVASFNLEEYETAKEAFDHALKLEPSNKTYKSWISKCSQELEGEANGMDIDKAGVAAATPSAAATSAPAAVAVPTTSPAEEQLQAPIPAAALSPSKEDDSRPLAPSAPPVQTAKYRHQWLQMQTYIEVAIFAKKLTPERVTVDIQQRHLHVVIRDAEGNQEYEMDIELYGDVDPEASKFELLSTKLELRLRKADLTISWPTLEKSNTKPAANWSVPTEPPKKYPTSSRHAVDWDKLEADLKEEEKKEILDGDAGVHKLFRDIYAGADEATRRAMNKSYVESNGTALSTNWKEVGSSKSQWKEPEDADVKKWEY